MSRRWSAVAGAGVAIAVMAAGQLVAVAPAHASAAQQVIAGGGDVTDDFGDEATLSRYGQYRHSNAVALWQWILKIEGLYSGAIDCDFGPATQSATVAFQTRYQLSSKDGIVGLQTWTRADNNLHNEGFTESSDYESVFYLTPDKSRGGYLHRAAGNGFYASPLPQAGIWVTSWDNYASSFC